MKSWEKEFQRASWFVARQFYHAALEVYSSLLTFSHSEAEQGLLYDELGKIQVQLGNLKQAVHWFTLAIPAASSLDDKVKYEMHLALAYRHLFEYDRAQRMLTQVAEQHTNELSPIRRAALQANLAVVQGLNGFFEDGLRNTHISMQLFDDIGTTAYHATLYNNLGSLYLHLGDYVNSELNLLKSMELENGPHLSTISELSRLRMNQGRWEESITYAQQALPFVWSSLMNSDKDDLATLCFLLASFCRLTGEHALSLRLLEKAQLFFGQLNLWRQWQQVESTLDDWSNVQADVVYRISPIQLQQIRQFIQLLDALNAQELLGADFARMLDMRVLYAQALANTLDFQEEQQHAFIYACRFADYGLTTVEPEVILQPHRSPHAWKQYQMHPTLSIDMLYGIHFPDTVIGAIRDHHERMDGTGYPAGKHHEDISPLARPLSVVDYYTEQVTLQNRPHSVVMQEIQQLAGTRLDAESVEAFLHTFRQVNI